MKPTAKQKLRHFYSCCICLYQIAALLQKFHGACFNVLLRHQLYEELSFLLKRANVLNKHLQLLSSNSGLYLHIMFYRYEPLCNFRLVCPEFAPLLLESSGSISLCPLCKSQRFSTCCFIIQFSLFCNIQYCLVKNTVTYCTPTV